MKVIKYSRQREAIKNFLLTRKDHPTADVIYTNIKTEFPNISLGTVYRNLALLTELGEIQKLSYGAESDFFDGNPAPHYHFVCKECGSVSDLIITDLSFVNTLASQNFNGNIEGHNIHFYGICEKCKNTEKIFDKQEKI